MAARGNMMREREESCAFNNINLGIVCPFSNEQDTAQRFIMELLTVCRHFDFSSIKLFVVIDNACRDNTLDIVSALELEIEELKLIWAPENTCVVDAYKRGYIAAIEEGVDWVLEIDAGFSHSPNDVPGFFYEMIENRRDCVFGTRFSKGGKFLNSPLKRYLVSKAGTILSNMFLGTKLTDMTSGFELFTREALEKLLNAGIYSKGPFFQTEIKFHAHNMNYAEVPICYSSASHNISSGVLKDALINYFRLLKIRLTGKTGSSHGE